MRANKQGWRRWLAAAALPLCCGAGRAENPRTVRVGYFANVTHATPIVGFSPQRHTYYRAFPDVAFDNKLFTAGPSAVEALRAGAVDLAFMGGGPALLAYGRARDIVVLANAAGGGSLLVARRDVPIKSARDLDGKRVAVPQIGNTQDILLRYQIASSGLVPAERGGSVMVMPVAGPDILTAFRRGQLDAACVPEPWGSRLIKEAGASVVLTPERLFNGAPYATTVLVGRRAFVEANPDFVRRFVQVTDAITRSIGRRKSAYVPLLRGEIKRLSGKGLAADIIRSSLARTSFTPGLSPDDLQALAGALRAAGYQKTGVRLDGIVWK